jgi:hypothetical protein
MIAMTPDIKSILALARAAKEARTSVAHQRASFEFHSAMSPDVAIQLCERLERAESIDSQRREQIDRLQKTIEAYQEKTSENSATPDPYDFETQGLRKEP